MKHSWVVVVAVVSCPCFWHSDDLIPGATDDAQLDCSCSSCELSIFLAL